MARFRSSVPLDENKRDQLIDALNLQLAHTLDLYSQAKHAHWNVKGRHFRGRHKLFDKVAEHLLKHGDLIAERIATLGGMAEGTVRRVAGSTELPELEDEVSGGDELVQALSQRLSRHARALREAVDRTGELNDLASQDLFLQVLRQVEMDAWMLDSHLIVPAAELGAPTEAALGPE